ncbi:hypothetical protein EDB85DRAFT_2069277 [Lactarius pseudohatsudake]|nr:hypothetical protein EDB85DRAFT_2069277 [Lactarius pseudohatsudake]
MTTRRRHHRRPRRRHRRSCLPVGVARRVAVALRRLLRAVRGGGGGELGPKPSSGGGCGGGVAAALARCKGWWWRRTCAWRWVGGGGHGLCAGKWRRRQPRGLRGRSPAAAGGVGAKGQGVVVWRIACPQCCPWSRGGGRCAKAIPGRGPLED